MEDQTRPAGEKHSVPIIDRMMEILEQFEHRSEGASITDLTAEIGQPRTTVYRILKTLQRHEVVRREGNGSYKLGARLLRLAASVAPGAGEIDLPKVAQPVLDRLALELGEGVKLSIVDARGLLVLAVAQSRREHALTVVQGQRIPIHAGAAGKMLLAHMADDAREHWLAQPMPALTPSTITDPKKLSRELARIRRLGWSRDQSEQSESINAVAAPVFDRRGMVVAAISVPYLAGNARVSERRTCRQRNRWTSAGAVARSARQTWRFVVRRARCILQRRGRYESAGAGGRSCHSGRVGVEHHRPPTAIPSGVSW